MIVAVTVPSLPTAGPHAHIHDARLSTSHAKLQHERVKDLIGGLAVDGVCFIQSVMHDSKRTVAGALQFTAKRAMLRATNATVSNGDWLNGVTK